MAQALAIVIFIIFIGLVFGGAKLPKQARLALVVTGSLTLAWLHWEIAGKQTSPLGFAASNRNPNPLAQDIGYLLAALGLANALLALKNLRTGTIILCGLFVLFPIMLLISI